MTHWKVPRVHKIFRNRIKSGKTVSNELNKRNRGVKGQNDSDKIFNIEEIKYKCTKVGHKENYEIL